MNKLNQDADPFKQFQDWYSEAAGHSSSSLSLTQRLWLWFKQLVRSITRKIYPPLSMHQPDAMVLATASTNGTPSARMVLFKGIKPDKGIVFYTNYNSRKGRELEKNPKASILFHWSLPERQVRWEGRVEKLSYEDSNKYWQSRPHKSQVSGLISPQSKKVENRSQLKVMVSEAEKKYQGKTIPCPENWGGYYVVPEYIEFWEGKANRLHHREVYTKQGNSWQKSLLAP